MNLLIIGNGFDIAHGLPTKYINFLEYIEDFLNYKENNSNISETDRLSYIKELEKTNTATYNEFYSLVNDNYWINYFIYLKSENLLDEGWIDFEKEISRIVQVLDSVRTKTLIQLKNDINILDIIVRQNDYEILEPFFHNVQKEIRINDLPYNDYFKKVKKILIQDLKRLIRGLEIYLSTYVESIETSKISYIDKLEIDKVLSFNYTKTYELLYCNNKTVDFDYIHGKADLNHTIDTTNIVLGIDEYLDDYQKNNDNEFVQFKKFYQRILKNTGSLYNDWLDSYNIQRQRFVKAPDMQPKLNVYIIGHSLDITDKEILNSIILSDETTVTIFHHSVEALEDQISNLVKIIGQEELIKRTYGKNQKIKFVPIPIEE